MRIGLLSDTHDRVPAVRELLEQMIAGGVSIGLATLLAGVLAWLGGRTPLSEVVIGVRGGLVWVAWVRGPNTGEVSRPRHQPLYASLHQHPL